MRETVLLARQPAPVPAQDGRTWQPVVSERPDGSRVYRVVLLLDGVARLLVGATDRTLRAGDTAEFSTWEPHALVALDRPAEALIVFRAAAPS